MPEPRNRPQRVAKELAQARISAQAQPQLPQPNQSSFVQPARKIDLTKPSKKEETDAASLKKDAGDVPQLQSGIVNQLVDQPDKNRDNQLRIANHMNDKQTKPAKHHQTGAPNNKTGSVEAQPNFVPGHGADAKDGEAEDAPEQCPIPKKISVGGSPFYVPEKKLGKGGFGQVWLGRRMYHKKPSKDEGAGANLVAIKFEHKLSKGCVGGSPYEWQVYGQLGDVYGIPKLHYKGLQDDFYVMVMDLLGPSLWDIWSQQGQQMSEPYVACVAMEAINILQSLHNKGYVHGDVKPENFLVGPEGTSRERRLFLVDLGLAVRYRERVAHIKYEQRPDDFRGTVRYASVHAHLGRTASRRDDLESLVYTLIFLHRGRLPWQGYMGTNKSYWVGRKKANCSAELLCRGCDIAFQEFADCVLNLRFEDVPNYARYISFFEHLVVTVERQSLILVDNALKIASQVGQKRGRGNEVESSDPELQSIKRVRTGTPCRQWVTVYNRHTSMKQRYHYNVATARLLQHIQKGWEDGLFISSVASSQRLWAIVMDAGTDFSQQIYKVHYDAFLPKEWIMEKWEDGYYITSLAGSDDSSCLVVMSRGSQYTQQSYKVSDSFPYEWIKKKWREGFYVTTMATMVNQWAVVMSKCPGIIDQVVEIDFHYPSEGIHKRWESGYRITVAASTHEQCAFVLSAFKHEKVTDGTQETLRTSTFPTAHIKGKWDSNLFLVAIAYGKTVS
uniref:non-specific serine/threonine protein kinase n=1 Tax=Polytomella parva TaxID=51329 RepID=A0A7S0YK24_9CHLO|mmetsp:Transcript_33212/g.60033  ORF Transcript_33212/g.60033 Transcript_33212/m.60033 type:complete len:728 (+) Transcript_33212:217-2400(+)|eukprot:CAMPEP_0175073894 /NCGR_PEP_ID=MMETSP0052_2-20121109/20888_1 /TAXON_ID=51329 ORGANISM="Polytomella parva, Strain SAG 63-3" /NCGR_SAMPLE_ID=MMETSP0052_2 /ASSEMBLY_ACC=CAM_ASM_000194 /LENGTH=727 /DNA_ID=CAMNT_0016341899 /DNA_START=92 /DNA_END=2275 /DNA_ORIENTATION=+